MNTIFQAKSKEKKYRQYTDEDKAFALVALDFNQGNVNRTSRELSIPRKTLSEWAKGHKQSADVAKKRQLIGQSLADKLDSIVLNLFDSMRGDKVKQATFSELIRAASVCLDIGSKLRGCTCDAENRRTKSGEPLNR